MNRTSPAIVVAVTREQRREAERDRGVAVVSAGVHRSRRRWSDTATSFSSRIGSASMSARTATVRPGRSPTQHGEHARLGRARDGEAADRLQRLANEPRGLVLLERLPPGCMWRWRRQATTCGASPAGFVQQRRDLDDATGSFSDRGHAGVNRWRTTHRPEARHRQRTALHRRQGCTPSGRTRLQPAAGPCVRFAHDPHPARHHAAARAPPPPHPPSRRLPPIAVRPPADIGRQRRAFTQAYVQALKAKRSELSRQLTSAQGRRDEIANASCGAPAGRRTARARAATLGARRRGLRSSRRTSRRTAASSRRRPADLLAPAAAAGGAARDRDNGAPFSAGQLTAISIVFTLAVLAPMAIAAARRMLRRPFQTKPTPQILESAARLERMEQAVDAIAVEVERISEGQRFVTSLMAKRESPALQQAYAGRSPSAGASSGGAAQGCSAVAGFRTRFSMKNSIIRSARSAVWPASGPDLHVEDLAGALQRLDRAAACWSDARCCRPCRSRASGGP